MKADICLLCRSSTEPVLELGLTPLANELMDKKGKPELFPLNLVKCTECNHLQIDELVNEQRLYGHYLYVSDTSQSNRDYFASYAKELDQRFEPKKVLDIGSNDGLFLSFFSGPVLGVDPAANIAEKANKGGIPTINGFFNELQANLIYGEHGKFDLITCNNCFAHNANLHTIVKGVKQLLSDRGVFVVEVAYAMDMMKGNLFDLIYHEHIHHWHLHAMQKFMHHYGLEVFDIKRVDTHGGSIRFYISKPNVYPTGLEVGRTIKEEKAYFNHLVKHFADDIKDVKEKLLGTLSVLKKEGKTVSILGYPAKATTICYAFDLAPFITDIYDDNKLKIGRFALNKKILPTSDIKSKKPDYLLILAWNYAPELMHRFKGNKFIVPLPEVQVFE